MGLEKKDAQSIADALLSTVHCWGLDMSCLVAQGYDGASVMSSSKNGVQANVRENVLMLLMRTVVLTR